MLAALLIALASAQSGAYETRTCTASSADSAAVATALRSWYAAEAQGDATKFHSLVTSDFFIFDGGRRLTAEALLEGMQRHYAEGLTAVWTITDPQNRLRLYDGTGDIHDSRSVSFAHVRKRSDLAGVGSVAENTRSMANIFFSKYPYTRYASGGAQQTVNRGAW